MLILLNWLKDFVKIPNSITAKELGVLLTTHTVEVEKVEKSSKLDDIIFEIDNKSITNRPDLWGHYGIAREISAFLGVEFKNLDIYLKNLQKKRGKEISVEVEKIAKPLCQRYMAIEMEGIRVEPSPEWMQKRLTGVGIKSINNIVDTTNYVMLEFGQPIHVFDGGLLNILDKTKIIVRKARKGESIKTLGGKIQKLDVEDLIIADGKSKPIAIAGIIGGVDSGVTDKTDAIVIEVANFDFLSIRKTSQKIGIRTESSIRFEKQPDPNLCELAMTRVVELIEKISPGAKISSNLIDIRPQIKKKKEKINLDLDWLNKRIGQDLKREKVIEILERLGFEISIINDKILSVEIPSWRTNQDISIPEDLLEEIVRIYGYNNLKSKMPTIEIKPPIIQEERALERKIRDILVGGPALSEIYNYSFVNEDQLNKLAIDFSNYIRLENPLSGLYTLLRQNLRVNLIENIKTNQENFEEIGLFEIGNVYFPEDGDFYRDNSLNKKKLPRQERMLEIVLMSSDKKEDLFIKIKGIIEYLSNCLDLVVEFDKAKEIKNYADIKINKNNIGTIDLLKDDIIRQVGIKKKVIFAEINLKKLFEEIKRNEGKRYQPIEKYPPLVRDLAFVVDTDLKYVDIKKEILKFDKIIKTVELFDVFVGGKLGENKKSLAFHIIYQTDKTLISDEADKLQKRLISHLNNKFNAKIRDF